MDALYIFLTKRMSSKEDRTKLATLWFLEQKKLHNVKILILEF